jgi:hypothetical protein
MTSSTPHFRLAERAYLEAGRSLKPLCDSIKADIKLVTWMAEVEYNQMILQANLQWCDNVSESADARAFLLNWLLFGEAQQFWTYHGLASYLD